MSENTPEASQQVSWKKIILPVSIGVAISLYLIITTFKPGDLSTLHFTTRLVRALLFAALTVVIRDFAFMCKIRLSSGVQGSWLKTLQTIIMWEFGAAISPKVGEMPFLLLVLKKSGISYGRSTAVIVLNTFLDNVLFIVMFTLLWIVLGQQMFSFKESCSGLAGHPGMEMARKIVGVGWGAGMATFIILAFFLGIALIFLPHRTRGFFHKLAHLKFLSRFKEGLIHLGDEIEITAEEYKSRGPVFWLKMILYTWVNWTARYILPYILIVGFSDNSLNMLEVFSRQYIIWIAMVIPGPPGSSGVAEIAFLSLNCEFMPVDYKLKVAITLLWRMYSYYLYLFVGMLLLPRWAKGETKS